MPATQIVFVRADGTIEREPFANYPAQGASWLERIDGAGRRRAFQREGYACSRVSDDEQDGALVFIERPVELLEQARQQERDIIEHHQKELARISLVVRRR